MKARTPLQMFIGERLAATEQNPFEAARLGGLERSFVNDILKGRKRSVRGDNLAPLATGLKMSPEELLRALSRLDQTPVAKEKSTTSMANERDRGNRIGKLDIDIIRSALVIAFQGSGMTRPVAEMTAQLWIADAERRAENQNHSQTDSKAKSDGQ